MTGVGLTSIGLWLLGSSDFLLFIVFFQLTGVSWVETWKNRKVCWNNDNSDRFGINWDIGATIHCNKHSSRQIMN